MPTDRVATRTERDDDVWYFGEHQAHGGNVQVLTDPARNPLWVSPVRPGPFDDLACAHELVLPALHPHTALDAHGQSQLPVLADKGSISAGIGVRTPVRRPKNGHVLDRDTRIYNTLLTGLQAPTKRVNALLQHWRALQRVSLNPWRISAITAAVLVIISLPRRNQ